MSIIAMLGDDQRLVAEIGTEPVPGPDGRSRGNKKVLKFVFHDGKDYVHLDATEAQVLLAVAARRDAGNT
jgi:hypothetical protein